MARFFPAMIPVQLATRPALVGEKRVWEALRVAPLGPEISVFYNRAPTGCRRRADILIVNPERGVVAIEVKNGLVHYYRKAFRQKLSGRQRWRKRIQPWAQAKRALVQLFTALGLNPVAIPHAPMFAAPCMARGAYHFTPGPHMLTAEDLAPAPLALKLDALLPRLDAAARAALAPAFDAIVAALTRHGDQDNPFCRAV